MNTKLTSRNKKKIEAKMADVFGEQIKSLRVEYQEILLEDLVSAFESRLAVLSRAQVNGRPCIQVAEVLELETA